MTEEQNVYLDSIYTAEEVVIAIKQMHPTKASGPDDMALIFFQKVWSIIGEDIILAGLNFLNLGMFLDSLNHTFISLISKKKNLEVFSDYRPISLCNVLYKVVAKVLANRLKRIIPNIISNTQKYFCS